MMNETKTMRLLLCAMVLAATAWPGAALAANRHAHDANQTRPHHTGPAHHTHPVRNPVVQHLLDVWEPAREKTAGKAQAPGVQFVVGNDVWQPGEHFREGKDWLALTCHAGACAFRPASLTVSSKSRQGEHDAQPTAGQQLSFRRADKSTARATVAWFHLENAPAWLKPGTVPDYGARVPAGKEDTRELEVELPGGAQATLVPMLLSARLSSKLTHRYLPQQPHDAGSLHLQLRADKKRQLLPGELGTCSHRVTPGYLLWTGDMDGDGKADYLISYADAGGPVHLYLSSAANAGQLVGLGGIYDVPRNGDACDGALPSYLLR